VHESVQQRLQRVPRYRPPNLPPQHIIVSDA